MIGQSMNRRDFLKASFATIIGGSAMTASASTFAQPVRAMAASPTALIYSAYVQNVGWTNSVAENDVAGTTDKNLRMEALKLSMSNPNGSSTITIRSRVSGLGWLNWCRSGIVSGTVGKGLQMEAVQIKLTGAAAEQFDVYYCMFVEGLGWLGYAKNGEVAGSTDPGLRAEAIQIRLVPKGTEFNCGRTAAVIAPFTR